MINKHYDRREHLVYFLIILVALGILATRSYGATTISTDVQSDGNYVLNSTSGMIQFANGWKLSQTTATTSQISLTDSASSSVVIFDEN